MTPRLYDTEGQMSNIGVRGSNHNQIRKSHWRRVSACLVGVQKIGISQAATNMNFTRPEHMLFRLSMQVFCRILFGENYQHDIIVVIILPVMLNIYGDGED